MKLKLTKKNLIFYVFSIYIFIIIALQLFVSNDAAFKVNLSETFEPISLHHFLGTDDYGRDLFSRLIIGARTTLFVTLLTLLLLF